MEVDDYAPFSALEHLLYCERQCALIHIDGVWIDNVHTTAGALLHARVDAAESTRRPNIQTLRNVPLRSDRLRLFGYADVVEFEGDTLQPRIVEYKRGRRQKWLHDEVQLAAQTMALEEMLGKRIPECTIYSGQSRRRRVVQIDEALRAMTEAAARRLHQMIERRELPPAVNDARCTQ